MGARRKLNQVHVAGSIALAALAGLASGSWAVFAITGALLLAAGVGNGDIRPDKHRRR